jgi:hypothetical protein
VNWSSKLESRGFFGFEVVEPAGMPESSFPSRDMFCLFCEGLFSSAAKGSRWARQMQADTAATVCCPCSRRGGRLSQFVECVN